MGGDWHSFFDKAGLFPTTGFLFIMSLDRLCQDRPAPGRPMDIVGS